MRAVSQLSLRHGSVYLVGLTENLASLPGVLEKTVKEGVIRKGSLIGISECFEDFSGTEHLRIHDDDTTKQPLCDFVKFMPVRRRAHYHRSVTVPTMIGRVLQLTAQHEWRGIRFLLVPLLLDQSPDHGLAIE